MERHPDRRQGALPRIPMFGSVPLPLAELWPAFFASPPPQASFQGLPDNTLGIPPDTHGAVGPDHVVTFLNTEVRVQDKTGGVLQTISPMENFWAGLGVVNAFDPRVVYDPIGQRYVAIAAAEAGLPSSALLLAVSQTTDPTGLWHRYKYDTDGADLRWLDFPTLGFNKDWIVVSGLRFLNSDDSADTIKVWAIDKAQAYAGIAPGAGTFTMASPFDILAPAETFDAGLGVVYLIQSFSGAARTLRLYQIGGTVGAETFSTVGDAVGPTSWDFAAPGFADLAPQAGGGPLIDAGDDRFTQLVYRNGHLWTSHSVYLPAGGAPTRTAIQWWQLTAAPTIVQRAFIDDGSSFFAYPSLGVNLLGDVLIGYSKFTAASFPSAHYRFRKNSDPANTLQAEVLMKGGEGVYEKNLTGTSNRWGDYSHTCVDPSNDLDLWTVQEYAATPVGMGDDSGRWGTWWVRIPPGLPQPAAPDLQAASDTGASATDNVTNDSTPTFTGTTVPNATVDLYSGVTLVGTATAGGAGAYTVTPSAPLAEGVHTMTVVATDAFMNSSPASPGLAVTLDLTAPVVTITTPTSGAAWLTNQSPLALGGTASDAGGLASVQWTGAGGGTATGTTSWSASLPLVTGAQLIDVTATDLAGNVSAPDSITVTYDGSAPTLTITNPAGDPVGTAASPVGLSGSCSDVEGVVAVSWTNDLTGQSGVAVLGGGGTTWSIAAVALLPGTNRIRVYAWDAAGNVGLDTVDFVFAPADSIRPSIDLTVPTTQPSASTAATPVTVGGSASDAGQIASISWLNQSTGVRGTAGTNPALPAVLVIGFSADVPLAVGANLIVFTARDVAGNETSDSITITLTASFEPGAPSVAIQVPGVDPFPAVATPAALSGIAADATGVAQVTWTNAATGGNGIAAGTDAWSADVPLAAGANLITVTATDPFGNSATDTVTVNFTPAGGDAIAPIVSILSPTGAAAFDTTGTSVLLAGIAADNAALSTVVLSNPATAQSGSAVGTASWISAVPLALGANVITVRAYDASGNSGTDVITVTRSSPSSGGGGGGGGCGLSGLEVLLLLFLYKRARIRYP
jgi:hypothetical protein